MTTAFEALPEPPVGSTDRSKAVVLLFSVGFFCLALAVGTCFVTFIVFIVCFVDSGIVITSMGKRELVAHFLWSAASLDGLQSPVSSD